MAKKLHEIGVKVTLLKDAEQAKFKQPIRTFGGELRNGGVGLFHFAGHGVQMNGRNDLIPVGATVESAADLEDQSVDASLVLAHMEQAGNRVNLVILDACRNSRFERKFKIREISNSRGLAQMQAGTGTLVAFATSSGSVASDGEGRNGIDTKNQLKYLKQPGPHAELLCNSVRM